MSLMRQTFQPSLAPKVGLLLAWVLVCALLVTQFGLTRHVVEHAAKPVVAAATINDPVSTPELASCMTCLEHQAHGAGLITDTITIAVQTVRMFELQALAPNTPYLTPERASQRAPPVLS